MDSRNLVVSGRRLEAMVNPNEGVVAPSPLEATASDPAAKHAELADFVGAEPPVATPVISDLERASMKMKLDAAVRLLREADLNPGVFSTTENQLAALLQSALAEKAANGSIELSPIEDNREVKFDSHDVRWALSLVSWIGKLSPHPMNPFPTRIETYTKDLKLALMGDWGTGLYGAPRCASSIAAAGGFDYVVHLGDVYYSGTKAEVRSNFIERWPKVPGARYRSCNGNHEMYSGGYGYFDELLPAFGQESSCFAIQNDHWLIVGLDSAYIDHDLAGMQDAWLKGMVDAAGGKKLVLFTHHQPFSHFDGPGPKLVEKLLPLLENKRITAWYWGHEHRCVVYDAHPKWGFFGRCIGHGGYPYFRKDSLDFQEIIDPPQQGYGFWRELPANAKTETPRAILLDGPNPDVIGHEDDYGPNGYMTLEFQGSTLIERYFLPDATELYSIKIG